MTLTLISGPMFASKSTTLLRRAEELEADGLSVWTFKPAVDDRYSQNEIVTHDGKSRYAHLIPQNARYSALFDVSEFADAMAFDEVQFLTQPFVATVQELLQDGVQIICAGLDLDAFGFPFETVELLADMADENVRLTSECACGARAERTQRLSGGVPVVSGEVVQVGGADSYVPRCIPCFVTVDEREVV